MAKRTKALATIKLPYEAERRDLVLAEINRELCADPPNWNYLDRLKVEYDYWDERHKDIYRAVRNLLVSLFGGEEE